MFRTWSGAPEVWIPVAVAFVALVWFLWPYRQREEHRRRWRDTVRSRWDEVGSGSVPAVWRPGFTTELPARVTRLRTYGLLLGYRPSHDLLLRDDRSGLSTQLTGLAPRTVAERRSWEDAARRYVTEIDAVETRFLDEYANTIGGLAALLPGGANRLSRKRTEVVARYRAAADAAADAFRPVHDHFARAHVAWSRL